MTSPEQYFYLNNGDVIRSFSEFIEILEDMSSSTFYSHVNTTRNDFSNWIRSVFGLDNLANRIQRVNSKNEMIKILKNFKK